MRVGGKKLRILRENVYINKKNTKISPKKYKMLFVNYGNGEMNANWKNNIKKVPKIPLFKRTAENWEPCLSMVFRIHFLYPSGMVELKSKNPKIETSFVDE